MNFKLLSEPAFHFLVIAAAISSLYYLFNSDQKTELVIAGTELDARILVTELAQGRTLSQEQRAEIRQQLIDDYVLVLEAYDLGLQNDARINDILAQKMRHVLSGNIIQPSDSELQTYYQQNLQRYQQAETLDATELVFIGSDPPPATVLQQLRNGGAVSEIPPEIDRIQGALSRISHGDLTSIFDLDYANQAFAAPAGTWVGPYNSARGDHWLKITAITPASTPTLTEVADQVRMDWVTEQEERLLQIEIARLRENYAISIAE